jgi:hypothetical protein
VATKPAPDPVPRSVATIDDSVTQGNRVTTNRALTPNDPVKIYQDKIKEFHASAMLLMGDLRAFVNEMEDRLNKLRVGL